MRSARTVPTRRSQAELRKFGVPSTGARVNARPAPSANASDHGSSTQPDALRQGVVYPYGRYRKILHARKWSPTALRAQEAQPVGMTPTLTLTSARDAYWYAHRNFSNAKSALRTHPDNPILVEQFRMMLGAVSAACARLAALELKQMDRTVLPPPVAGGLG